jgi:hypothetical protein
MTSISDTLYIDRAVKTVTFVTRAAVAVGIPTYIFLKLNSLPTLRSPPGKLIAASFVVLSTPSTLYCALGAIEGFVRACGHCFNSFTQQNRDFHWDKFSKEMTTLHGLARGGLSPLSGYATMHREWNKLGLNLDKDSPRVLKEEYFVYSIPRAAGQALVKASKWVLRKLKVGFDRAIAHTTRTIKRVWVGVCWITNTTISAIKLGWRVSQPLRQAVWNIMVTIANWSIDRIIDLWNITRPIRTVVKLIVWDVIIKTMIWDLAIQKIFINWILTKLIWNFAIKTVLIDWLGTKLIWNFMIETLLCKVIWPPVKFICQRIIWPTLKTIGNIIRTIISYAFSVISWATQQAFKLGR